LGGHYFLFGPRGTGKSTWLRQAYEGAAWIDLLAPDVERRLAARPERLREIVAGKPVAGELGEAFDLERALSHGLLPVVDDATDPADTLAAYVGVYVKQEVQAEALVRDLGAFHRFLEAASFSQAAPLNLAEVARECQVSRTTAEGYLEVLEDLLLAFRVPVFTRRARRQLTAHPKLFRARWPPSARTTRRRSCVCCIAASRRSRSTASGACRATASCASCSPGATCRRPPRCLFALDSSTAI